MRRIVPLALAACAVSAVPARAALLDGFNHSEYEWMVLQTQHFNIVFHKGLEDAARVAAEHAETIYPRVVETLDVRIGERTDIILADYTSVGIFAGTAFPLVHRVWLYGVTIYGGRGDRDEVLKSVLTHEFVHICQYWKLRRGSFSTLWEIINQGMTPGWFLEGTAEAVAQYATDGPPSLDYYGNSLLRCALLEDDLTSLAAMGVHDWDDIADISLTYRAGQSMCAYIAREWGAETWGRLMREHAKFPFFDRACREILGVSEKELFRRWRAETKAYYEDLVKGRSDVREYSIELPDSVQKVFAAKWSPDGKRVAVMAYKDVEEYHPGMFIARADGSDMYAIAFELDHLRSTHFSWSPDGRYLAYSGYYSKSNGRVITGIFVHDIETGQRRLITGDRVAMDPAWSPKGDRIAFVLFRESGLRHDIATMAPDGSDMQVLTGGEQMPSAGYAPTWDPTGTRIACEVINDNGANIAILNADGSGFEMLTDDKDNNYSPAWSPDGRNIAFLCARETLTDLWSVDLETGVFSRHTDEARAQVALPEWTLDSRGITLALQRTRTGTIQTVSRDHVLNSVSAEEKQTPPPDAAAPEEVAVPGGVEGVKGPDGATGEPSPPAEETPLEDAAEPDTEAAPPFDDSTWRIFPYSSKEHYETWLIAPNSVPDGLGATAGLTYRGSDTLNQQNLRVHTSYGLVSRRPNVEVTYLNSKNRVDWQVYAFDHTPSPLVLGGNRMQPRGRGVDLRASYARAVGSSTYRRESFELATRVENGVALELEGLTSQYPRNGWYTYLEGKWTRTKYMPDRGNWAFITTLRQSVPGVSQYPLQEAASLVQYQYSSSAGRQTLTARLEGGVARAANWFGQPIVGGYVRPTLTYRFRIADDALPGLYPYLYPDRIEGRVTYQYNHNYGIPLYQPAGHSVVVELENQGYITKGLPYSFRFGVVMSTRNASLRPVPYWRFNLNLLSF